MESMVNSSFRSKPVFHFLPLVDPETPPISTLELFMTIATSSHYPCRFCEPAYDYQRWLLALLIFLTSFRLRFQYIGSIKNTYQMNFLFSLEIARTKPTWMSGRRWYDVYRIHLGVTIMKIFIFYYYFFFFESIFDF